MTARKNSKGVDIDKFIESGKKTRFCGESAGKAQKKSTQAYKRNLDIKRITQKLLTASPQMTDTLKDQLKNGMGIDVQDGEMLTVAALIAVKLTQQAMNGDMNAARMVLEMGGQVVDAKTAIAKEQLQLERERLKLEGTQTDTGNTPTIIIKRADE